MNDTSSDIILTTKRKKKNHPRKAFIDTIKFDK